MDINTQKLHKVITFLSVIGAANHSNKILLFRKIWTKDFLQCIIKKLSLSLLMKFQKFTKTSKILRKIKNIWII